MYGLLTNLFLDGVEPEVELDEVREDGVEVRVQLQQDDLAEVGVVDVGEHVEEQPVDLPDVRVERRGELLTLHGQNKLRERGKLFIKRINCTPKQYSTPYNFDRRMLARGQGQIVAIVKFFEVTYPFPNISHV